MTEQEWMACEEPLTLLDFINRGVLGVLDDLPTESEHHGIRAFINGEVRHRKRGLLGCACCRAIWALLVDERSRNAVEVFERFIDGDATSDEVNAAKSDAIAARNAVRLGRGSDATTTHTRRTAAHVVYAVLGYDIDEGVEETGLCWATISPTISEARATQAQTLRCIFGNPFRPVVIDREWLTSTVTSLAQGIYDSRDLSVMPILADALQDAGCDNDEILDHCRDGGPHARGCWVVDLVLGKE